MVIMCYVHRDKDFKIDLAYCKLFEWYIAYTNLLHHVNNPPPVSILLGLIRRVLKILHNKHAEKEQVCHRVQKKFVSFSMLTIECFLTRLVRPNKGRNRWRVIDMM